MINVRARISRYPAAQAAWRDDVVPDGYSACIILRNGVGWILGIAFYIILCRVGLMLESGKILMTTDGDSFTAVNRADNLSIAGDNAHAGPVEHAPYAPGRGVVGDGLISQLHVRGHAPGHRYAQDAALHEPRPFACLVDRVLEGYFVFAVQGLSDRAGNGDKCAQAVVTEICAISRKDTNRGVSPPRGQNKKHRTLIRCLIGSSRETGICPERTILCNYIREALCRIRSSILRTTLLV